MRCIPYATLPTGSRDQDHAIGQPVSEWRCDVSDQRNSLDRGRNRTLGCVANGGRGHEHGCHRAGPPHDHYSHSHRYTPNRLMAVGNLVLRASPFPASSWLATMGHRTHPNSWLPVYLLFMRRSTKSKQAAVRSPATTPTAPLRLLLRSPHTTQPRTDDDVTGSAPRRPAGSREGALRCLTTTAGAKTSPPRTVRNADG